jgi:heme exporter protein D
MEPGSHIAFVVSAYAIAALVVVVLMAWIWLDYRRQRRLIADLETRGIMRRSARSEVAKP